MNGTLKQRSCYNMLTFILICLAFLHIVHMEEVVETLEGDETAVTKIFDNDFLQFKSQKYVTVMYFYKKELPRLKQFLKEYKKTASLMKMYEVKFGMGDCTKDKIAEYCEKPNTENNVYIFRDGLELLHLTLETMFDVNSIFSNVMQIVLLREVPILQTPSELEVFETENIGKTDIIFSHQRAIGTYEHRILMEVAYGYNGKYRFALTTEDEVVQHFPDYDKYEESSIWILNCKTAFNSDKCTRTKYLDKMDLQSLGRFVRVWDRPHTHDIAMSGDFNPYEDNGMHSVFIFYDTQSKNQVVEEGKKLIEKFRGLLGVVSINTDVLDAKSHGYQDHWKIPALAIKLRFQKAMQVMDPSSEVPEIFVWNAIFKGIRPSRTDDSKHPPVQKAEEPYPEYMEEEEDDITLVEKQDDPVAEAVTKLKHVPIDRIYLPVLTDKTFPKAIHENDFLVVIYYLTFDARSMAFLRACSEAAQVLHADGLHPLAGVECYDWTDVCGANNITIYPTVRVYRKNKPLQEYKGLLSAKALVSAVKMYIAEDVYTLTSTEAANKFLEGNLPEGAKDFTNVAVLGLQSSSNKKEMEMFRELAEQMHGRMIFGMVVNDVAKQLSTRFSTKAPRIVVYKRNDKFQPFLVVPSDTSVSINIQAVLQASLPVFPELTPINFPAYFAKKQPFVLYFTKDKDSATFKILGTMARSKDFPSVVFSWMSLSTKDGLSAQVLAEYLREPTEEALVLVNHQTGNIYYYGEVTADQLMISTWLSESLKGERKPINKLQNKEWKPRNKGYDFLKFMDNEAKEQVTETDDSFIATANEHGIGFNADGTKTTNPMDFGPNSPVMPEAEEQENEMREELNQVHNNRLYASGEKSSRLRNAASDKKMNVPTGSDHTEL